MTTENLETTYYTARGLRVTHPESLNKSMQLALGTMTATLFGDATMELTDAEQAVLKRMGMSLESRPSADPLAETAAEFAAMIDSSLTTSEAGNRTGLGASRIRQMVADRNLYSILLENRRYLPIFQFVDPEGRKLVPNIGLVNKVLDPEFHPVQVLAWYTTENPDLLVGDDIDQTVSPLDWLKAGNDPAPVVKLAEQL